MTEEKKVTRRDFVKVVGGTVGGLVVGAAAGYLLKPVPSAVEKTVTQTVEKTVTTTVTATPKPKVSGQVSMPLHKPPWLPGLQELIALYEKSHPDTKINLDLLANIVELRDKEIMDAREGTGLWDLYSMVYLMACQIVYYKWAYKVQDLDPSYKVDPDVIVQEWLYDDEGVLRGLPLSLNNDLLFYRRDLFEEKGLKVPPDTWDDVLEAAKALYDPKIPMYGFVPRCADDPGLEAYVLLRSYGGDYFVDWKEKDFSVRLNDEHGLAAFERFAELLSYAPPTPASLTQANMIEHMAGGTGAQALIVYAGTPWMDDPKTSTVPGKVDFANCPAGTGLPGCAHTPVEAGWAMAVSPKAKNKELAIDWMEFCTQPETQLVFAKAGVAPVSVKAAKDPELMADPKYRNLKTQSDAMRDTVYQPNFPEVTFIVNPIMKTMVQDIATGKPVKEALNGTAETIAKHLTDRGYKSGWTKNLWEK